MNHRFENQVFRSFVFGLVAIFLAAEPHGAGADTPDPVTAYVPCAPESGFPLVEADGMGWFPEGYTPDKLAFMAPDAVAEYAGVWAAAYETLGVDRVVLAALARDLSSWGAVEPVAGRSYERYQMTVLDALVQSYRGKALVVLSSENPWDHGGMGLPTDRTSFGEYVRAVVERYDGDLDFGVPAQDPSYPDIDGTGQVTPADWEATPGEKQAWADAHVTSAYMVESVLPDDPSGFYTTVLDDVLDEAVKADKEVRIWIAPIPLGLFGKAKLSTWLGPFADDSGPVNGLASILATLPATPYDITARSGMEDLADLHEWLKDLGFRPGEPDGVELVLGGIRPAWGAPTCPSPQCDDQAQTENLAKVLSLATINGAGAGAFDGLLADPDVPTGFGMAALSPLGKPPMVDFRPAMPTAPLLARALGATGTPVKINTPVPSTHVVQAEPCEGVVTTMVWYDWTLEVGKDQPYGDLSKALDIDLDPALSRAFPIDVPDPDPRALDTDDLLAINLSQGNLNPADGGGSRLILDRTPVLVVTLESGWGPPEETEKQPEPAEEIPVPDQSEATVETNGGGSCATGLAYTPPGPFALVGLLALVVLLRRRVGP